ncbi:hypothetical protein [Pseudarthrobacter oxydans]|uniref:hypothetical protein n=1 Tax=Pseudarthrobacter oxydans TaxID=1671 RepID=UPI00380889A2
MNVDQNLAVTDAGTVVCRSCEQTLGTRQEPLSEAISREQPSTEAGPGIRADPSQFSDPEIVLRQKFCPGCLTLLSTEIVPKEEPSYRRWNLAEVPAADG